MNRRSFLQSLLAMSLAPSLSWAAVNRPRYLVLVELKGGNDGLNTVVPYRDPLYRALRPGLALDAQQVLPLSEQLALHPSLEPLMPLWQQRDMAVVLGVGYPQPNRSHFRSIDIWNTASDSGQVLQQGWLSSALSASSARTADGLVLSGDTGPLVGLSNTLSIRNLDQFQQSVSGLSSVPEVVTQNAALQHLLTTQHNLERASASLLEKLKPLPGGMAFPKTQLGRQAEVAYRVMHSGLSVPVIKLSLNGFDTHAGQLGKHQRLLGDLGQSIASLSQALRQTGEWNDVLIMTYSEFGRRASENASKGTDHGTAAPHFVWGGQVKGGVYGQHPNLAGLQNGDLVHTVDFRSLYATVMQDWWGQKKQGSAYQALGFVKA